MFSTRHFFLTLLFFNIAITVFAGISLPKIFSDNMVLQRDKELTIWGRAEKGEKITVKFNGQKIVTSANDHRDWTAKLAPMHFGGPYDLVVYGEKDSITLKNILIGDVWLCSGQSNMERVVKNMKDGQLETTRADYPMIRFFTVKKATAYAPKKDLAGESWVACNPVTAADFSAVAYYFGRQLNRDLQIPIGLINSSWGGTKIQAWMSWKAVSELPEWKNHDPHQTELDNTKNTQQISKFKKVVEKDKGITEKWYDAKKNNIDWSDIQLPGYWESSKIGDVDGAIWFKKKFELNSDNWDGNYVLLNLGPIDDRDITYVNGVQVGSTNQPNSNRLYRIESSILKKGKNYIVIKVIDDGGHGGIYGKPEQIFIKSGLTTIALAGMWQYKPSVLSIDFGIRRNNPNSFPSLLFNAMIAPITNFAIKGVIWYQGEANAIANEADKYESMFPLMIADWRNQWGSQLPFLWAQLANYMMPESIPGSSEWALLREAQSKALRLPYTGQAVLIDIGEAKDIHPKNKQDVGYRLALNAEKVAYGKDIVYSGPTFFSMVIQENKILLGFKNIGSGLYIKGTDSRLRGFAIAGIDQKFVWADAQIKGDKVIVSSPAVKSPVAVRYAWGNNPAEANLYNKEGLPAAPFRTDKWVK